MYDYNVLCFFSDFCFLFLHHVGPLQFRALKNNSTITVVIIALYIASN